MTRSFSFIREFTRGFSKFRFYIARKDFWDILTLHITNYKEQMADTGTVRFMVTYMPISVIVKRKSDQMLLH